jgi:hypothetical protein
MTVVIPPSAAPFVSDSQESTEAFSVRWWTWASIGPGRITLPVRSSIRAASPGCRARSASRIAAIFSPTTAMPAGTRRSPRTTWSDTTTRS